MKTLESFLHESNCGSERDKQQNLQAKPQQLDFMQQSCSSMNSNENLHITQWWFTLLQQTFNLQIYEQQQQQQNVQQQRESFEYANISSNREEQQNKCEISTKNLKNVKLQQQRRKRTRS